MRSRDESAPFAMPRRAAIEAALGSPLEDVAATRGGDANSAAIARIGDQRIFVKWNDHALPGQFRCEALGLALLRDAVADLAIVPRPLAHRDAPDATSFLAMEWIDRGSPGRDHDERLGRALAAIHRTSDARGFGFEIDGACGTRPQPNGFLPRWSDFYARRRLRHQARLCAERGMAATDVARIEAIASDLAERLAPSDEPPALIHGDLWSGNVFAATDGRPVLADPAPYFADREAEFGMMRLFGNFSPRVYAAYDEAFPRRHGHEQRLWLYRLYHELNHFAT
jgi:fructosamine-3-kinase